MKAVLLEGFGDPTNFRPAEVPAPTAGPGQVLIRVTAASLNPVDTKLRKNGPPIAPELPGILGCDASGTVEAVGEGVAAFRPGDAVYACAGGLKGLPGCYAEYMAADARLVALAPSSIPLRDAAALPLAAITAWEGMVDRAQVGPGVHVLVHGGAGGVGHLAIQIAKAHGATVTATVSSEAKAAIAKDLGADHTVNYREEAVDAYVARLTGGRGFDVVFDTTGGSDIATSFAAARLNGRVVTIVAGYTADLSPMHAKGLDLSVVFMLIPMLHDLGRERHGVILTELARLVDAGRVRPLIDPRRFALAEVADAHRHLESGQAVGKIVIDVA